MINLNLSTITDRATRDALSNIQTNLVDNPFLDGEFKLLEITTSGAVAAQEIFHNLGFVPSDIITTKHIGSTYTWDWTSFTKDRIYITTAGAVTLRILIGHI